MNTAQNVYIVHKSAFSGSPSQVLREGSSVFVRIISQTGPQSYEAAFSGARFSVSSSAALQPGTSFTATVSLRDGKIALVPQQGNGPLFAETPVVQNFSADIRADGLLSDGRLAAYFTSLGLAPDAVTLALFNGMKELGMRFDPSVLNKARRIGASFPGREKEAAEASLILEQKGLPSGENAVEGILGKENGGGSDGRKNGGETQNDRHKTDIAVDAEELIRGGKDIADEVRRFFTGIFSGTIPAEPASGGVLTVFNHRGFCKGETPGGTWIQIPFDIFLDGGTREGKGLLRCFLEENHQKSEKFVVKLDFAVKSYFFVLYYLHMGCKKIRFCSIPDTSISERENQKSLLKTLLADIFHCDEEIQVEWAESDSLSGFCTDTEYISVVRGAV